MGDLEKPILGMVGRANKLVLSVFFCDFVLDLKWMVLLHRYGMQNYIRDNGGFIKRMYGDSRFDRSPSKVRAQGPLQASPSERYSRKDDGV